MWKVELEELVGKWRDTVRPVLVTTKEQDARENYERLAGYDSTCFLVKDGKTLESYAQEEPTDEYYESRFGAGIFD